MMDLTTERRRPYAAPANVIAVLHRCRARNMPEMINNEYLRLAGITEQVFGRVREALLFLGLVGGDDRPTDTLRALAAAPGQEYRELLARTVREAYREDFERIDPGRDTQVQIVDAFRPYQPKSQASRMVMLFLGLCREAAIPVLDAPRERSMKSRGRKVKSRASSAGPTQAHQGPITTGGDPTRPRPDAALLFGVTEKDIAALDERDFDEVWSALGKVARARARTLNQPSVAVVPQEDEGDAEEVSE